MEEKRAKTLEALSTFIQSQKTLLNQTQSDLERLRQLKAELESGPECSPEEVLEQVARSCSGLSEQSGITHTIARDIDWTIFKSSDPASLKELASSLRRKQADRAQPSTSQTSELSELQKLVKDTRANLLDPVLASYSFLNEPMSDAEEEPPDPEELRRAREREKIRELKNRRFNSEAKVPVFAGLRRPMTNGVFIRRDQEDESAEVDISLHDDSHGEGEDGRSTLKSESEVVPMDLDTPPTSVTSPASATYGLPETYASLNEKPVRERRPPRKLQSRVLEASPSTTSGRRVQKGRGSLGQAEAKLEEQDSPTVLEHAEEASPQAQKLKQKGKPKSDTYKQAWSVSEQHLLERLLEEIPEGEKNRWAKISKAMNGRRTARQVASRVQKYFEKLKKFGVDVGGSKRTS